MSISVTSGAFSSPTTLLSWTQPPGTTDEVRGYFSVSWPSGCWEATDTIQLRFRDQAGVEISTDQPNTTSPAGNGGSSDFADNDGAVIGHPLLDEPSIDFVVPIPIEQAQFRPPADGTPPAARSITVQARRGTGCTSSPTVSGWQLWVTRFVE